MKETWKPTVAGVMNGLFGLPVMVNSVRVLIDYYVNRPWRDTSIALVCIFLLVGVVAVFSSLLCLFRRRWRLATFTSLLSIPAGILAYGILSEFVWGPFAFRSTVPVYSILGGLILVTPTVLVLFSKKDFRTSAIESTGSP